MVFDQSLNSHKMFTRLAKALIRLRICTGWSETAGRKYHIVGNLMSQLIFAPLDFLIHV